MWLRLSCDRNAKRTRKLAFCARPLTPKWSVLLDSIRHPGMITVPCHTMPHAPPHRTPCPNPSARTRCIRKETTPLCASGQIAASPGRKIRTRPGDPRACGTPSNALARAHNGDQSFQHAAESIGGVCTSHLPAAHHLTVVRIFSSGSVRDWCTSAAAWLE